MRFNVRGAESATGRDVTVAVEAASADEAAAHANAKGIFVASVEAVPPASPAPPGKNPPPRPSPERAAPRTPRRRRVLLAAAGALVLVPLLVWWQNAKDELLPPDRLASVATQSSAGQTPEAPGLSGPVLAESGASPLRSEALQGTFATGAGSDADLSITFDFPRYQLNPSRTFRWTAGTTGTWYLQTEHPSLTPEQKARGWCVLMMTRPNDPSAWLPAHIALAFDPQGQITEIHFYSFMGVQVSPTQQMTLTRRDSAKVAEPATADSPTRDAVAEAPGLGRAGYTRSRCLICRGARSVLSQSLYSDRRGFGLCDGCGPGYRAWERMLADEGQLSTTVEMQLQSEFGQRLTQHFHQDDDEGRRGIGLFMLTGKFASDEWHALTGSD